MSSSFGEKVKIMIFGQSHSEAIGVVIDGLPVGEEIDLEAVRKFMERRAPGRNAYSTPRKEADLPRVVSGLFEGKTCGAPICAVIENTNTRSKDYDKLKDLPRPGHADFTAWVKYKVSASTATASKGVSCTPLIERICAPIWMPLLSKICMQTAPAKQSGAVSLPEK